jgi:hypothetical protein
MDVHVKSINEINMSGQKWLRRLVDGNRLDATLLGVAEKVFKRSWLYAASPHPFGNSHPLRQLSNLMVPSSATIVLLKRIKDYLEPPHKEKDAQEHTSIITHRFFRGSRTMIQEFQAILDNRNREERNENRTNMNIRDIEIDCIKE